MKKLEPKEIQRLWSMQMKNSVDVHFEVVFQKEKAFQKIKKQSLDTSGDFPVLYIPTKQTSFVITNKSDENPLKIHEERGTHVHDSRKKENIHRIPKKSSALCDLWSLNRMSRIERESLGYQKKLPGIRNMNFVFSDEDWSNKKLASKQNKKVVSVLKPNKSLVYSVSMGTVSGSKDDFMEKSEIANELLDQIRSFLSDLRKRKLVIKNISVKTTNGSKLFIYKQSS